MNASAERDVRPPRVFVASSAEGLDVANAISQYLVDDSWPTVWTGAFDLSSMTMEGLETKIKESDFGVFVLSEDDQRESRNEIHSTPRDNVILELGMMIGHLSQKRAFIVTPTDVNLRLPTDLLGVTPARYDKERARVEPREALSVVGGEIRAAIKALGPVERQKQIQRESNNNDESGTPKFARSSDEGNPELSRSTVEPSQGRNSRGASVVRDALFTSDNGWREIAGRGWLQEASDADIREGERLVHLRYGLGEILGFSPEKESQRTVSMRFSSGLALIPLDTNVLFRTERGP